MDRRNSLRLLFSHSYWTLQDGFRTLLYVDFGTSSLADIEEIRVLEGSQIL